jgi:hypothetical protein
MDEFADETAGPPPEQAREAALDAGLETAPPAAAMEPVSEPAPEPAQERLRLVIRRTEVDKNVRPEPPVTPASRRARAVEHGRWFVGLAVMGLLTLMQTPFVVLWALQPQASPDLPTGTLVVETQPSGIEVRVDGGLLGTSPMQVTVPSGLRTLRLVYDGRERVVPVQVPAGQTVRHSFEFVVPAVQVDAAVPIVEAPPAAAPRPVPARSLSGWVHVDVPVLLRIFEDGVLLGTTDVDRLMLPVGEHVLDLRSDELQFTARQTIKISTGATTALSVHVPSGSIAINARPWAEAFVDGERNGDTPIGNLMRPIGRHEIVLRHPELGERRQSVVVTLAQSARVSVDFRAGKQGP